MTKKWFPIVFPVLLGLSLATLSAQDHDRHDRDRHDNDRDSGRYVILNAQYGSEYRHVDVTHRLRELARQDVRFRVETNTMSADPAPGRPKVLRVFAREGDGDERSFDFPDGTIFDGAQFRGWGRADWGDENWNGGWEGRHGGNDHDANRREFHNDQDSGEFLILSAQYGTERRHVDVTRRLKELASRDLKVQAGNGIFGVDPDRGHFKVLRIYVRDPNGSERMFEYPEYSWIDGSRFRGWGRGEWGDVNDHWSGRWNVEEHEREEHQRDDRDHR